MRIRDMPIGTAGYFCSWNMVMYKDRWYVREASYLEEKAAGDTHLAQIFREQDGFHVHLPNDAHKNERATLLGNSGRVHELSGLVPAFREGNY